MTKAYKSQKSHPGGRKQSRDHFIPQASIPAFELEKKGKMLASSRYSQAKTKAKTTRPARKKK